MQKKRLITIVFVTVLVLLIPLVTMQFTNEVKWTLFDFIIAGGLLFVTGIMFDTAVRKVKNTKYRIALLALIILGFLLIWAVLAVGIFGI